MKIEQIEELEFNNFVQSSPYKNFYQTTEYGKLMDRHGFDDYYLVLKDELGNIKAGTLILVKRVIFRYRWGYCPRGFLIDFNDKELLKIFTEQLRLFLKRRNFMFVRLDPQIIYKSRNNQGEIIPGTDNQFIYDSLIELGYTHSGFNLNFENMKPRWNAVISTDQNEVLFSRYSKEIRNKIRKAERHGVEVIKGNPENIKEFYSIINKKYTRKLNYYLDLYEIFSRSDMVEIYFANLNTVKYVKGSKELFEEEEKRNNIINEELEENVNSNNTGNIIRRKMESDNLLNIYKQNIITATNLYKEYPAGIIIGASIIIKYNHEIFFLIDDYKKEYASYCPNHYIKFQIIEKYRHEGFNRFNLNGISGDFNKENEYYGLTRFKLGFGSHIEEFLGQFDLIIDKGKFKIYEKINPIIEWLNTPLFNNQKEDKKVKKDKNQKKDKKKKQ